MTWLPFFRTISRGIGLSGLIVSGLLIGHPAVANDTAEAASVIAAYTLVAPVEQVPSGLLARAVVPAGVECPILRAHHGNGRSQPVWHAAKMTERKAPQTTYPAFAAVSVCEAIIPDHALAARIGPFDLPAGLPKSIHRIAVLADTGCRIGQQDCSDPEHWPLARISVSIAAAKPDIIFYLGDFYYRGLACPEDQTSWCGSTPAAIRGYNFQDTDYSWLADALIPMRPLFSAAPLLVLRGNHEDCPGGGNGYFLFFDPRRDTASVCAPKSQGGDVPVNSITPPWSTELNIRRDWTLRLALVDSASPFTGDFEVMTQGIDWAKANRASFVRADEMTKPRRGTESWLLVHRPAFGLADKKTCTGSKANANGCLLWSSVPTAAASYGLLDHYHLILSSHLHLAQATQIPGQPPQLVIGNGGTFLYPDVTYAVPENGPLDGVSNLPAWVTRPYPPARSIWTAVRHGYAMLYPEQQVGHWTWRHYAPDGQEFARCLQGDRTLDCRTLGNPR